MNTTKLPVVLLCGNAGVGKDTVGEIIATQLGFKKFSQADTIKEIARDAFGFTEQQLWGPSEFRNALDFEYAPGQPKYKRMFIDGEDQGDDGTTIVVDAFVKWTGANRQGIVTLIDIFMKACKTFADSKGGLTPRIVLQLLGTEVGRAYSQNIWVDGALRAAELHLLKGAPGVVVADGRFRNEIIGFRRWGGYVVKIDGNTSLPGEVHASEAEIAGIPEHFYDAILYNTKATVSLESLANAVNTMMHDFLTPYRILPY